MRRGRVSITVRPAEEGGWVVLVGQDSRDRFDRKRDATLCGRQLLQRQGGGELVIHSLSGRVIDRDTVAPA